MAEDPITDGADRFHVDFSGRTLLGLYRVEQRLAEGGRGTVYRAQDTNLGRPVAVKVKHARFLAEPGFRTRFRREVEELAHPPYVPHVVARVGSMRAHLKPWSPVVCGV